MPNKKKPPALPASSRFDEQGLMLPCRRGTLTPKDADAVAAIIIACGAVDDDPADSRLNGWRFYRGPWSFIDHRGKRITHRGGAWFADYRGKTRLMSPRYVEMWLHKLLSKCIVIDRTGQLHAFIVSRENICAVRCALGRALTVCDDRTASEEMRAMRAAS